MSYTKADVVEFLQNVKHHIIKTRFTTAWAAPSIYRLVLSKMDAVLIIEDAIRRANASDYIVELKFEFEDEVTPTNGGDSVPVPSVLQDKPKPTKSPVEKSVIGTTEFFGATVVVIDGDKLEREVLKASIADGDVQKLLPFQTKLVVGKNHIHIKNASAYTAETNYHSVGYGDTICAKQGPTYAACLSKVATCPGCLAKAKDLIVNHLLNTPGIIR